jgi:hypothetical protein
MSALDFRADLHQLIDQLDERFLKAVHSMVSVYQSSAEEDPVAGYDLHGNPKRASEMITVYEQRLAAMEAGEYISAEDLRKDAASWTKPTE